MLLLSFSVVSSKETQFCPQARLPAGSPPCGPMWHVPTWVLEKAHFPLEDRAWRKSMPVCADSRHTSRHPGPIMPNAGPEAPGVSEQPRGRAGWLPSLLGRKDATRHSPEPHAGLWLPSHRTLRLLQKAANVCSTHPVWQQVLEDGPSTGSSRRRQSGEWPESN